MGDAKKRGPYERRKAEALTRPAAEVAPARVVQVGDAVNLPDGRRIVVTEIGPTGLKGQVVPHWSNYGA
jgi:hypothetical protein